MFAADYVCLNDKQPKGNNSSLQSPISIATLVKHINESYVQNLIWYQHSLFSKISRSSVFICREWIEVALITLEQCVTTP